MEKVMKVFWIPGSGHLTSVQEPLTCEVVTMLNVETFAMFEAVLAKVVQKQLFWAKNGMYH
jgi:hypothetical protein